jgi:hypothetical protein
MPVVAKMLMTGRWKANDLSFCSERSLDWMAPGNHDGSPNQFACFKHWHLHGRVGWIAHKGLGYTQNTWYFKTHTHTLLLQDPWFQWVSEIWPTIIFLHHGSICHFIINILFQPNPRWKAPNLPTLWITLLSWFFLMTYNQKIMSYLPLLFKFEVLKAIVEPNLTPRYDYWFQNIWSLVRAPPTMNCIDRFGILSIKSLMWWSTKRVMLKKGR